MIATVAVGTDGSETAGRAMEAAFELAERFGASLVVLSAYGGHPRSANVPRISSPPPDAEWMSADAEQTERILIAAEEAATERGLRCSTDMAQGNPGEVLVELAARHGADVLVVGNKGMQRRVLGSVPNTVTHNAACSVYLVKTM
jgi:nucleotide-binding universal stress UspA family protein